jgi:hypothetical protein
MLEERTVEKEECYHGVRSEPGKGKMVELYFVMDMHNTFDSLGWGGGDLKEDFAASTPDVVVKIDPACPKDQVIRHLSELVSMLAYSANIAAEKRAAARKCAPISG